MGAITPPDRSSLLSGHLDFSLLFSFDSTYYPILNNSNQANSPKNARQQFVPHTTARRQKKPKCTQDGVCCSGCVRAVLAAYQYECLLSELRLENESKPALLFQ
jgi:hypothetical protein